MTEPASAALPLRSRLGASLCLTLDRSPASPVPWVIAFVFALAVQLIKAPEVLYLPQFFGEDGPIFFTDQFGHVAPRLFKSYQGYLHLIPRLVAYIANFVPLAQAPRVYCLAAVFLSALCVAGLRTLPLRLPFLYLILVLAITPTGGDVFGVLTNVHWFGQLYLVAKVTAWLASIAEAPPLAPAAPPKSPWPGLLDGLLLILVGLSGPFSVFATATAGLGWLAISLVRRRVLLPNRDIVLIALAATVQFVVLKSVSAQDGLHADQAFDILPTLQAHITGGYDLTPPAFYAILIVIAVLGVLAAPRRVVKLLLSLILCWSFVELLAGGARVGGYAIRMDFADRYFLLPRIALWWCLGTIAFRVGSFARGHRGKILAWTLAIVPLLLNAWQTRQYIINSGRLDMHWTHHVRRYKRDGPTNIPINPSPWEMRLAP